MRLARNDILLATEANVEGFKSAQASFSRCRIVNTGCALTNNIQNKRTV